MREDATSFVVRPGHDLSEAETVTERTDGYWVVQKDGGLPAALAIATDNRTLGGAARAEGEHQPSTQVWRSAAEG